MHYADFFDKDQILKIHEASLEIVEDIGLIVRNEKARDVFSKNGCIVDNRTCLVKIPKDIVEKYRKYYVPDYIFTAQDPKFDINLKSDRPVIVTGSSAPNIIDPKTGEERRSTSTDIANIAYLINELDGFDVFSISTLADDAPKDQISLSRFYPALKNCKNL